MKQLKILPDSVGMFEYVCICLTSPLPLSLSLSFFPAGEFFMIQGRQTGFAPSSAVWDGYHGHHGHRHWQGYSISALDRLTNTWRRRRDFSSPAAAPLFRPACRHLFPFLSRLKRRLRVVIKRARAHLSDR